MQAEIKELLIILRTHGPMVQNTSLNNGAAKMSRGQENNFILSVKLMRRLRDIGLKLSKTDGRFGGGEGEKEEGVMLDLI